ncbi:hypothetical protein J1N35_007772 [Gossypium stocksii]|uniref:Uncharacterized protein n=1 Tax=Gossypium stocksii TaxID=47602 RepID=A0A9D3W710_9ROSI|nr:hypothetical protein J1N35_007772 [Gossypium stocksii]
MCTSPTSLLSAKSTPTVWYITPNTRGKSKVPTHSKKRKPTRTSSSSFSIDHHRYLTFDHPPFEERY